MGGESGDSHESFAAKEKKLGKNKDVKALMFHEIRLRQLLSLFSHCLSVFSVLFLFQ